MGGTVITPNYTDSKTKIAVTPIIDEVAGYMDVRTKKSKCNLSMVKVSVVDSTCWSELFNPFIKRITSAISSFRQNCQQIVGQHQVEYGTDNC